MSNASQTNKLKGNERCRFRTSSQSDGATSSFSSKEQETPGLTSQSPHKKCGGRGMIFQQLAEESKNSSFLTKKTNLDFSNASIEQHFKQLREENEKKIKIENEMKWKKMFSSD